MRHPEHRPFHRAVAAAIALAAIIPFTAWGADPTPDPPEPYVTGPAGPAGFDRTPPEVAL